MNPQQPLTQNDIIPLFLATFQGSSTSQISHAYNTLLQTAKNHTIPFLKASQKILETQPSNHYLCQSVSNFIKYISKFLIDNRFIISTGPKDFINKIQNIFDNDKISLLYKQNIAFSYIKAAFHFQISLEKVIGRISFLYNTKQILKAALLSRAFLASETRLDAKTQNLYYNKILKLQINNLDKEIFVLRTSISNGKGQNLKTIQSNLQNIHELLKNLHIALFFIAFEKFETSIFKCLQSNEIINVANSIQIFKDNSQILILLRELTQKIIESLFRMRRIYKLPNLVKVISENIHLQWRQFQQNLLNRNSFVYKGVYSAQSSQLERQLSQIRLITAGLNSRIILILDESFDIVNVLIRPLFEVRSQVFQKNPNGVREILMLFEDTCFSMKSECLEVEFNKFVKSLLTNYEIISSKLYLTLDQVLFSNKNFQDYLTNNQNTVVLLLSLLAFQTSYFMTNIDLMTKLDSFLKKYQHLLFDSQNIELYFHSLLLIFNYLDDIFYEELKTHIFQIITRNFINRRLQSHQLNQNDLLIAEFEKKILKSFYQRKYADQDYLILIQYLATTFDQEATSIYIDVIKNYRIEDKITLDIFERMFESVGQILGQNQISIEGSLEKIRLFTKFLEAFFDTEIYKHLFESTLARVLPFFEVLISSDDYLISQFFNIIKNAVKHLEVVPQNYYSWMSNLFIPQRLQSEDSFYSLISVLKQAKPSRDDKTHKYEIFVNFTALTLIQTIFESLNTGSKRQNQLDTSKLHQQIQNSKQFFAKSKKNQFQKRQFLCLLSLHQLIYYHSSYLTRKTLYKIIQFAVSRLQIPNQGFEQPIHLRSPEFSFIQGKYQLLFIILFRRRLTDVNQILCKMNIQKRVYNAIYMRDSHYLIEYDTPILIKEQSEILKNLGEDKLQISCANTAFLVIFYKFTILYEIKIRQKKKQTEYLEIESSDSDEEEFEMVTQFKTNFKEAVKVIKGLPLPQEWSQINELKEIKEFIQLVRSTESGREWLKFLINNCMTKEQVKILQDLMKDLEIVNGTYRHIKKVNKMVS